MKEAINCRDIQSFDISMDNIEWTSIIIHALVRVMKSKEKPYHTEGLNNSEWVLIDFVNVVVHVFQQQYREFYKLEELWGDAKQTKIA